MNLRSIFIYLLIFILAFVGFVFISFPGKEAGTRVAAMLNGKDPGLRFSIGSATPGLPFSLNLNGMTVSLDNKVLMAPDSFEVSFSPLSLLGREKKIGVQGTLSQGRMKGSLLVKSFDPFEASGLRFALEKIRIRDFPYHSPLAEVTLTCDISGEYRENPADPSLPPPSGKQDRARTEAFPPGSGSLVLENVLAHLENSWFNLIEFPDIDFSSLAVDFTCQGQRLVIARCVGKGAVINIKLNGEIRLAPAVEKSRLNLTGKILPDSPYLDRLANQAAVRFKARNVTRNGIDFFIKGTLENPRIGI